MRSDIINNNETTINNNTNADDADVAADANGGRYGIDVVLSPEHAQARLDAIQTFSLKQIKWISLLPIIPAILSLLGSLCIIKDVVYDRRRRNNKNNTNTNKIGPYERIMLSMSLHDIFYTIVFVISPFLTDSDKWWPTSSSNVGSTTSCRIMGTLFQYSLSNQLYYGMLSYYFVLTIRFHISKSYIVQYGIELSMHIFAIGWPFITSIWGLIVDWYDELEFFPGCWIDNYPKGCIEDECLSPKIAWIVSGTVTIFTVLSLIVNYLLIACYIRKGYSRYNNNNNNNSCWQRNTTTLCCFLRDYFRRLFHPSASIITRGETTTTTAIARDTGTTKTSSSMTTMRISLSSSDRTNNTTNTVATTTTSSSEQQRGQSSNSSSMLLLLSNQQQQKQRSKLVSTQATLYIATYFVTYLWFNLLQIVEGMNAVDRANFPAYPFMILQAIFSPLGGFWNCLIYFRPRFIQNKQRQQKNRNHMMIQLQLQQQQQQTQERQEQQRGGGEGEGAGAGIVVVEESTGRSSLNSSSGGGGNSNDRRHRPEQRPEDDNSQYRRNGRYNNVISNNSNNIQNPDDDSYNNEELVVNVLHPSVRSPPPPSSSSAAIITTTEAAHQQWISGHFLKRMATIVSSSGGEASSSFWTRSSLCSSSSPSSSSSSSSNNNNDGIADSSSSDVANDSSTNTTMIPQADKPNEDDNINPTKKEVCSDPSSLSSSSPSSTLCHRNRSFELEEECVFVVDDNDDDKSNYKNCEHCHDDIAILETGMAVGRKRNSKNGQKDAKQDGNDDDALSLLSENQIPLDQHRVDEENLVVWHRIQGHKERDDDDDDVHPTTSTILDGSTATIEV